MVLRLLIGVWLKSIGQRTGRSCRRHEAAGSLRKAIAPAAGRAGGLALMQTAGGVVKWPSGEAPRRAETQDGMVCGVESHWRGRVAARCGGVAEQPAVSSGEAG